MNTILFGQSYLPAKVGQGYRKDGDVFHSEYQPTEMTEIFTAAERAKLDAGEHLIKYGRVGYIEWVSASAWAQKTLNPQRKG